MCARRSSTQIARSCSRWGASRSTAPHPSCSAIPTSTGCSSADTSRRRLDHPAIVTRTLALAALTVLELSPPEMVACAAAAGYSHVGLRLVPATDNEPTWPVIGNTPIVRELEQRLGGTGVRVLDIEIFRLKPETDVQSYLPALETGARLGAKHVL